MKSLVCDEEGAEIVEFAFAATIFFTLLLGIIEFCLVVYAGNVVATAAQQGTRYAMVRGSDWTNPCSSTLTSGCQAKASDVQNYILSVPHPGVNLTASDISVPPMTTTANGATCIAYSRGCQVKVSITYPFQLNIPFLHTSIPLTSTSIETIQD